MASPLEAKNRKVKMKLAKIIFLALGVYCFAFAGYAEANQYVRVSIVQDVSSLRLKVNGFYEIIIPESQKVLYRGKNLNTTVTAYKEGISIGTVDANTKSVLIKPADTDAIVIDDRKFRGDIQIIKKDNLNLWVINHIELEDYIKGILYHEASHFWPMEALKAQAVACRTYAVYQMEENRQKDFDLTSDIYSQVYGGKTSERYRTNTAVEQTRGGILAYQGKVFPAYFHATCAGHTEDASVLWNINIPPLKGVACGFCQDSPHFSWHVVLSQSEVAEKLNKAGYKINNIKEINIAGRDNSGRIASLKIVTAKKNISIPAKDFRNIIGPNIIRSTNFQVSVVTEDIVFEGLGWGHGVGLCQWGAYFMDKKGYNYKDILKYYYPGSDVETLRF